MATPTLDTIRRKTSRALVNEARRDPMATGHRFQMLAGVDERLFEQKFAQLKAKLSPPTSATASPEPRGTTPEELAVIVAEETAHAEMDSLDEELRWQQGG